MCPFSSSTVPRICDLSRSVPDNALRSELRPLGHRSYSYLTSREWPTQGLSGASTVALAHYFCTMKPLNPKPLHNSTSSKWSCCLQSRACFPRQILRFLFAKAPKIKASQRILIRDFEQTMALCNFLDALPEAKSSPKIAGF